MRDQKLFNTVKKIDIKTIFPYFGLLGVIVFFQLYSGGRVLSLNNFKALISECFFIIVGVTGYVFIMAQGNLDFSIGSTMGLCCATAAVGAKINPLLALPFGIVPGIVVGYLNGFVHVKLKIGSLIGTLAVQFIVNGILVLALAGGSLTAPFSMLKWNTLTVKFVTILLVTVIGFFVFQYTAYGKRCRAIGSCEESARQSGVKVGQLKIIAFMALGAMSGMLGFFSLIRTGTSTVTTGSDLFMNVLCAALLGGIPLSGGYGTKFSSVIIGSLTMAFLTNGMVLMGLSTYDKQLIKGIVFLITVAVSFDRKNLVVIK